MVDQFVSMDYILTFAGMVVIVNMLTQFTKKMFDRIGNNRTKWVVAGFSLALCVVAGAWKGKFSNGREITETCVLWLINSIIVWFTAMKAYETVAK
ncbi:MAG: hypothetical protein N2317_08570 [Syntrophales bacterium]|nr:hypothetical protein [Syntrophales bacterium]